MSVYTGSIREGMFRQELANKDRLADTPETKADSLVATITLTILDMVLAF
jgi:hypothetical protein